MVRVVGIDHLVIRVSDFDKSKAFYGKLFKFLGFKVLGDYGDMIGWTNGKTRFWIAQADADGLKHPYRMGDVASTITPSSSEAAKTWTTWKPS